MGVLACSRRGCKNDVIVCFVPKAGYICWECEKEFKDNVVKSFLEDESDVIRQLIYFMRKTEKVDVVERVEEKEVDLNKFFDKYRN